MSDDQQDEAIRIEEDQQRQNLQPKVRQPPLEKRQAQVRTPLWWIVVLSLVAASLILLFGTNGIGRVFSGVLGLFDQLLSKLNVTAPLSPPSAFFVETCISYLSVIILLIFVCIIYVENTSWHKQLGPEPSLPDKVLAQFTKGWLFIWITWLMLYTWLSVSWSFSNFSEKHPDMMWTIADGFNVLNSFAFFYCFLVLDIPSIQTNHEPNRATNFHYYLLGLGVTGLGLWGFELAASMNPEDSFKGPTRIITMCYTSLAMAFLMGKFDNHHMQVPRIMLAPLYLYVIIQPTWADFGQNSNNTRSLLFALALIMKIMLFLLVRTWIRDGSIRSYLEHANLFYQRSNEKEGRRKAFNLGGNKRQYYERKDSVFKIFLASSAELLEDRDAFELYFRRQNDQLRNKGVYLEIVRWENFLNAMSDTRLQDEYNEAIRKCDIFVCLFFTKTGKFTEEEFNTAFGKFKDSRKPRIYTFFKNDNIKTGSMRKEDFQSLWEFKDKLAALGHFHTFYDNIEHLKREFRDQLDRILEEED